jgi:hypothetical protein
VRRLRHDYEPSDGAVRPIERMEPTLATGSALVAGPYSPPLERVGVKKLARPRKTAPPVGSILPSPYDQRSENRQSLCNRSDQEG